MRPDGAGADAATSGSAFFYFGEYPEIFEECSPPLAWSCAGLEGPWRPLLDPSCPNHGLMLPILLYCVDALGGPMFEPPGGSAETHEHTRGAYHDIPIVIPAIRDFWMPQRVAEARRQD